MDTTAILSSRIDKAMTRIKAATVAAAELNGKLDALQEAREKDLAELDALIEELEPLVGED